MANKHLEKCSIISHQRNVNQHCIEVLPHPSLGDSHQENKQSQKADADRVREWKGIFSHCWCGYKLFQPLWKLA